MSTFQFIATGVFVVLILVGVGVFATFSRNFGSSTGAVTIWGTTSDSVMEPVLAALRQQDKSTFSDVVYVQKNPKTYVSELINAMASGNSPDLFLVGQDQVTFFADKITPVPYSSISQGAFLSSYIDEGQLFLTPQGTLALPFMIDPLVMYWNRDLLAAAGIARPPQYWDELLTMAPKLTVEQSGNVTQSAVGLGEWSNIAYAKQILSALIMQAGDPIVTRDQSGKPTPTLGNTPSQATENPSVSALQYYTEFANPSKTTYSWNRALPNTQDDFVAGNLALYFGLASDYPILKSRNPNLNFAVAQLPQIQNGGTKLTFGQLSGIAISHTAPNPSGALAVAQKLASQSAIEAVVAASTLPPARRDVSIDTSKDAAQSVFTNSALIAHGWLDPDPSQTDPLFQSMIESVVSGSQQPAGAVFSASQVLQTLLHTNQIGL